jgi:hypothetical protein
VITKLNSDCSGYVFSNNLDQNSSLFMAEHRHALSVKEIAPKFLMEIMTEVIGGYAKKIDELFDVVHEYVIFGSAPTNGRLVETWLKEKIGSKVVSGVIAFRGITSKKEYDRHVWMPNVFFNHDELVSLVANLQPLYLIARTPKANDRDPFLDAVKQCIEKMAPGTSLKTDQLDDILKRAMGINEPTPILRYPIKDVLDNQKVKDPEYRAILSDFMMNYEKLDWILKNKNYKYKMEYNGITYYWIAVQDMP